MTGILARLAETIRQSRPAPEIRYVEIPARISDGPGRGPRPCPFWWCDEAPTGMVHWLDHVSACAAGRAEHIRRRIRAAKERQAERLCQATDPKGE